MTLKTSLRALRRHHAARLKTARKTYGGRPDGGTPAQRGKLLNNPAMCSCFSCGNPRKWFSELTMQERRLEQHHLSELLADC